jgi:anti-sigma factor RsiW
MNCLECQEHLLDYLDNELPASLQGVVAEHLQACMTCREEVESYRKTMVLLQLRAVPEPAPTYWDEAWENIYAGFKARLLPLYGKKLVSPSRWLWLKPFPYRRFATIAALFIFFVATAWWTRQIRQSELAKAALRSATVREMPRSAMPATELLLLRGQSQLLLPAATEELSEDVRRQIELIAASRAAFGSIDPISKSAMLARMEVERR